MVKKGQNEQNHRLVEKKLILAKSGKQVRGLHVYDFIHQLTFARPPPQNPRLSANSQRVILKSTAQSNFCNFFAKNSMGPALEGSLRAFRAVLCSCFTAPVWDPVSCSHCQLILETRHPNFWPKFWPGQRGAESLKP